MVPVGVTTQIAADASPIVVLLGAGASKDAGLRLATELTDDLREEIQGSGDSRLVKALGLILGGLSLQNGIKGDFRTCSPGIETVLRVAQHLANRNNEPLSTFVGSWHPALEELAPNGDGVVFQSLIHRAYDVLCKRLHTPDRATQCKYLVDVCKLNHALDTTDPPPVFTLNYDRCLEFALDHEKKPFTTGFRDGLWTAEEFTDPGRVRLYKMHGSFGWIRDPESSLLYDKNEAVGRDDIHFYGDDAPDELIFGTDNKLRAQQPFLWMAHRFYDCVYSARYVVTIGYGFGDDYINQIIQQGMSSDESKQLVVVGPGLSDSSLENAKGFNAFYPRRTRFIADGAKRALHDEETIISAIKELEASASRDDPFAEDANLDEVSPA